RPPIRLEVVRRGAEPEFGPGGLSRRVQTARIAPHRERGVAGREDRRARRPRERVERAGRRQRRSRRRIGWTLDAAGDGEHERERRSAARRAQERGGAVDELDALGATIEAHGRLGERGTGPAISEWS